MKLHFLSMCIIMTSIVPTTPTTTTPTTTPTTSTTIKATTSPTTPTTPTPTFTHTPVKHQHACMATHNYSTGAEGIPDSFQYECSTQGDIFIKYSNLNSSKPINFKFVEPNTAGLDHCTPTANGTCKSNDIHFIISECEKGKDVYVSLDQLSRKVSNNRGLISGGTHYSLFVLKCPVDFDDTLTYKAFALGGPASKNNNFTNDLPVHTMKVVGKSDTKEVTQALVGDYLRLMVSTTDINYFVKVLECSANDGADLSVQLWQSSGLQKTNDPEIFDKEWTFGSCSNCPNNLDAGHSTFGKFHAFRFSSSNVVIFSCEVRFCFKISKGCKKTAATRRRREAGNKNHYTKTTRLTRALTVHDIRSGSSKPDYSKLIVISVLMMSISKFI